MLYQYDVDSKLWIDVINEANALRDLINEYLSPTVDTELFLLNKFVRMFVGLFVTVISLDDNDLLITTSPAITDTIIFKVDMKLTIITAWRLSCSDKKDRDKKHRNLTYWKGVKAKSLKYACIKFKINWYTTYCSFYLSGFLKLVSCWSVVSIVTFYKLTNNHLF